MDSSIVKVTDKGQISIPKKIQESAKIQKGDELVMVSEDGTITMRKVSKDTFGDLLKHSEAVAEKLWSTPEDDVWDTV